MIVMTTAMTMMMLVVVEEMVEAYIQLARTVIFEPS